MATKQHRKLTPAMKRRLVKMSRTHWTNIGLATAVKVHRTTLEGWLSEDEVLQADVVAAREAGKDERCEQAQRILDADMKAMEDGEIPIDRAHLRKYAALRWPEIDESKSTVKHEGSVTIDHMLRAMDVGEQS